MARSIGVILFLIAFAQLQIASTIIIDEKPQTRVELGKKLFFDPILSADNTISCASCHQPKFAYGDNKPFSLGVNDSVGVRNTPSVMNMSSRPIFFHDGRASSLESQAVMPIENPIEMNLSMEEAVEKVKANEEYFELFSELYHAEPTKFNITHALAEFQRSLESDGSAPFDLWATNTDETALSESQLRGRLIFISNKSKCFDCHFGPDFTGDEFRNIGLYDGINLVDKGRFEITKDSSDLGKFKVPVLRNVALTAPYMHNGMFQTLEEVIDYYNNPYDFVEAPINMDPLMTEPLNLTQQEKEDLVNFLHSLTDENIPFREEF
ncbi:MAG: cytochrome c peroxidase [Chitinophagales bacterium]